MYASRVHCRYMLVIGEAPDQHRLSRSPVFHKRLGACKVTSICQLSFVKVIDGNESLGIWRIYVANTKYHDAGVLCARPLTTRGTLQVVCLVITHPYQCTGRYGAALSLRSPTVFRPFLTPLRPSPIIIHHVGDFGTTRIC